jgi:Carboxypeptidase regulatory-like domain
MNKKKRVNAHLLARPGLLASLCVLLLAALTGLMTANAQNTFGTVVGNVTDPSGALIPKANVTLTSEGTGQTRTMKTTDAGTYSFVNLEPGNYSVKVEQPGFKTTERKGVVVQVGSTTREDVALTVGDASQQVEVTAAPPLIQTDSATLGSVVEQKTIGAMPLNGRNVNNLLTLVPGVVAGGSTSGSPSTNIIGNGNYQIGGGFGNQSIFYVDGVLTNIPENNSDTMIPSQDDVAEFKVDTNDVSAEYGGFAGGVVNISTKSGTNELHGSAYEYLRNKVLNANDFFSNRYGHKRLPYVQNQYGFTIGGPVMRNKLFFFTGIEWEPIRQATTSISTVPTTAMMGGDFRAVGHNIYDTSNCSATVGSCPQFSYGGNANVIPPGDIDPAMVQLLKLEYPAPNVPNAVSNNFIAPSKTSYNQRQINGRIDWTPSSKDAFFARYAHWNVSSIGSNIYGLQSTAPGLAGHTDDLAILGNTYTLNPTTIIDAHFSYLRSFFFTFARGLGTDLSSISPGLGSFAQQQGQKIPMQFNWSGTPITGQGVGGQLYWYNNIYTLSGSVTKIIGRHTIKAGANVRQVSWIATPDSNGGIMSFTGTITANPLDPTSGYSFASGLLGKSDAMSTLQVGGSRAFMHSYAFYGTDTYQVTQKLTANLGLRWDQPGVYSEVNNYDTVILPDATSPLGAIANPSTGQQQTLKGVFSLVDTSLYPSRREEILHYDLFGPRIGITYRVLPNTVVRTGYGITYLPSTLSQDGPNSSSINSSLTQLQNSYNNNDQYSQVQTTALNPFPGGIIEPPRRNATALQQLYGQNIQSRLTNQHYSYVQQWNFTVQRQFGSNTSLSLGYAGARGTHLQMTGAATWSAQNINQMPDQYDICGTDPSQPQCNGHSLTDLVNNPFYQNPAITTPSPITSPQAMSGLFFKPMPQYNYVTASADRVGMSSYNAMQASFKQQLRGGGVITAAYTWSKLLSNTDSITGFLDVGNFGNFYVGGVQDNNNLKGEKSLSLNDYPQDLTISYVIPLPFGRGQRFLAGAPTAVNAIISGWRMNGVTSFVAGTPLGIGAWARDPHQTNYLMTDFGGGGYLQNQNRSEPLRPNLVPGCDRKVSGSAVAKVNAGKWFNTACFVQPGQFSFGNERRTDSVLRRQGVDNWDFSIAKSVPLVEKFNMTFDAEFFNTFNRVQFAPPFESMSSGPLWGAVTSQLNNPRYIQFGLRFDR